jgi:hypothetical protein
VVRDGVRRGRGKETYSLTPRWILGGLEGHSTNAEDHPNHRSAVIERQGMARCRSPPRYLTVTSSSLYGPTKFDVAS